MDTLYAFLIARGEPVSPAGMSGLCMAVIRQENNEYIVTSGQNPDGSPIEFRSEIAAEAIEAAHQDALESLVGGYRNVHSDGSLSRQY